MPDVDLLHAAFVINLLIPLFLIYLFIFGHTCIGYNIPIAWEITRLHNICIAPQLTMLSFNVHFWCHFYSSTKMVVQGCTSNALSGSDISLRSAITDVLPLAWPGLFLMMIESSVKKCNFSKYFWGFLPTVGRKFSYSTRVSLESIVFNRQLTICPLITSTGVILVGEVGYTWTPKASSMVAEGKW